MSDNDDSRKPSRLGPGEKQWLFWAVGLVALGGVVLYANLPKGPVPPSAVEWASSLDAAKSKAAETDQLLLIDFYATWCGPCQMMDREVYPRKEAAEALANFVAVKVDVDKQPQIVRDYQIWGMPTLIVLSPQGKEIARVTEGMDLQSFVKWIRQADEAWKKKDSGPTTSVSAGKWSDNLDAAKAEAARTNRLLLVDLYATWCGPCQMMDREVYPRKEAAEALANWVAVKVDVDKQPQIARDYQIWGMPTLIVLSPQGKEIARVTEGMDLQTFVNWIKQVEETWKKKDSGPTTPVSADKWSDNLDAAKAEAARTSQLLLVDFYATWCGPCQMLDHNVFPEPEVVDALANWVRVKVDVDKHPRVSRDFGVYAMPTLVVLSPQGKEIERTTGYLNASQFVGWIEKAEKTWDRKQPTTAPSSL